MITHFPTPRRARLLKISLTSQEAVAEDGVYNAKAAAAWIYTKFEHDLSCFANGGGMWI